MTSTKSPGRISNYFYSHQKIFRLAIPLFLFLVLFLAIFLSQQINTTKTEAAGEAVLSFIPQNTVLPPDNVISLQLSTDSAVAFMHIEITFDRTKIRLANETMPIEVNSQFQRQIILTDKTTANNTGKIVLALGTNPGAVAPTGPFEVAKLQFTAISPSANDVTSVALTDANILLVDPLANPLSLVVPTQPATLTLNPDIVPTPSASIIPTATPIPSLLPSPSLSATSCDIFCKSENYSAGTCRQNPRQCTRFGENNVVSGNVYCTNSKYPSCCCGQ